MNDEWKMPGTEQEENEQPVGEESEVTEATAVKEPEAGETAEAMPEATESQEPEVSERVEVTETTEEAATNGDGQVAKTEEEKPEISVGSSAGKRAEERTAGGCDGYSGTATGTAGAEQSGAQPENSREAASYHWVNPDYQKRQNGADGGERASQNTYENQNYREDVSGTADTQNYTRDGQAESQDNGGWGQPVGGNHTTKEMERQQFFRTDDRGLSEW